jgi:hypothetical protein
VKRLLLVALVAFASAAALAGCRVEVDEATNVPLPR